MGVKNIKEWKKILKTLRKNFPVSYPIVIKRIQYIKNNICGVTYFNNIMFHIYINNKQSFDSQIDAVLHEYSHVVGIDEIIQHKGRWGEIYSEIYRQWEKINNVDT